MATTESPTVLDRIFDLAPGDPVTLRCQTTTADIYYKGPPEYGREPFTPEESHLRAIPYTIQGKFLGIEDAREIDGIAYILLSVVGESAILRDGKFIGTETRTKVQHVPIVAINKITYH